MAAREAAAGQSYECFPDIPFEQVMAQLFRDGGITQNANALGVHAAQLFRILSIDYIKLYPHVLEALALLRKKAAGCGCSTTPSTYSPPMNRSILGWAPSWMASTFHLTTAAASRISASTRHCWQSSSWIQPAT